jgi:hypothetical protein
MSQPAFHDPAIQAAIAAFPPPQFVSRTRMELPSRDTANARQFEHWQAGSKHGYHDRPDPSKPRPYYDMAPNTARTSDRNYRTQPRFDTEADRDQQGDYFKGYDTRADARNMIREMRGSVYEDKTTGFQAESARMLERQFDNRWLRPDVAVQQAQAAEMLRPKMDDIRMFYKNMPVGK